MKTLGHGWQYTVYDLGNGRVLKKYNSLLRGYAIIFRDALWWGWPPLQEIPERYRACKQQAAVSLEAVSRGVLEPWMMANPTRLPGLDFEQDKVTPMHTCLRESSTKRAKELIDAFVARNTEMLRRGVIDKSFKIGSNFGLDAQGRVVLMDLGELYLEPEAIEARRRRRPWTEPWTKRSMPNDEVYEYFLKQMEAHFSL